MKPPSRVEVLCVGSELLSGKVNTHVAWLAEALSAAGLSIAREATLGDSVEEIRAAVAESLARSRLVLVCGGLGPTFDDITREGVAAALRRPLRYRAGLYRRIHARLLRYHRRRASAGPQPAGTAEAENATPRVPPANRRQAYALAGASVIENRHGSAPGQLLRLGDKTLVLLPGPPGELRPMLEALLPRLRAEHAPRTAVRRALWRLCGITESDADERLRPLLRSPPREVEFTILAHHGFVDFQAIARARDAARAGRALARIGREVERLVGKFVYGRDGDSLESAVGGLLGARRLQLATAESCTAGLLAARLTSVPGSSRYYAGGVVAYANAAKTALLGVSAETLRRRGAVSAECAREMASGAAERLKADVAVSVTGIAGPSGGSRAKPVGLVFVGLHRRGRPAHARRLEFSGDRETVRERSTIAALTLLYECLKRVNFA